MTDYLHPQRETYPLVNTDDQLVMVFRHHIPATHAPTLYIRSMNETELRVDASRTLDDRAGYEVLDYTAGGGDTVTLTVNGGAPTVLTEGVDFDAVVSNEETAIQIAAAINTAAIDLTAYTVVNQAFVYVVPTANAGVKTFSLASSDASAWTQLNLATIGALITLSAGQTTAIQLPSGSADPLKTVSYLKLFKGRVSVDLRSPVEVRTYFRQPATLSGNTGHPGGWPTTP